jgi:hypothetical protein
MLTRNCCLLKRVEIPFLSQFDTFTRPLYLIIRRLRRLFACVVERWEKRDMLQAWFMGSSDCT